MLYYVLDDVRYWVSLSVRYIDIYRRLAEGQANIAFGIGVIFLLDFVLIDRSSWLSLLVSLIFFVIAKWLAKGVWIEESLLNDPATVVLKGKTFIIVGASRGIGLYVAKRLASLRPSRLIVGVRGNENRVQDIVRTIREESGINVGAAGDDVKSLSSNETRIIGFTCDLNDLRSVVKFVDSVKAEVNEEVIDCLICNAGCLAPVDWRAHRLTPDGFEMSWQSNVLGHFLITENLIPLLMKSQRRPRVIHMSSIAHTWTLRKIDYAYLSRVSRTSTEHQPVTLYAWSKLAQIYHVQDLHERYGNSSNGLIACAVHPGIVRTEIHERSVSPIVSCAYKLSQYFTGKSIPEGAQTVLYCALAPNAQGGQWYHDCKPCPPSLIAQDHHERKQCLHWLTEARRTATPRSLGMRGT